MVFSSFSFLFVFLPITLILYFIIPKDKITLKNIVLLVMSMIFYTLGETKYFGIMILSIVVNYVLALFMKRRKCVLILAIVFNIGLLCLFKYVNFFICTGNALFHISLAPLNLTLPIGISFYTFQIMSYIIDVYKGGVKPQKNIINLATYIVLFPQLIAGPIVNYKTVEDDLKSRKQSWSDVAEGLRKFIIGLGKKVIIANNVAILADTIFNMNFFELGSGLILIGAIAYALQIYFDFSGYSDMAIGLGKIFGFHFLENFNYPYTAKSITDFWRRWHISLSSWFREYVYIPLGGNRCSKIKWLRNILVVWMLTGFWHGANWNFILWGLYFAIILVVEKIWIHKIIEKLPSIVAHVYSIVLILYGWIIFRVEDIHGIIYIFKAVIMFKKSDWVEFIGNNGEIVYVVPFFILGLIGCTPIVKKIKDKIISKMKNVGLYISDVGLVIIFGITIVFILSLSYNPFIYFRF
ncbi:MAG: MBOAT family protein [Clostridia bacterium]|nr:MBOAT family protein [Clostridia bacterium]